MKRLPDSVLKTIVSIDNDLKNKELFHNETGNIVWLDKDDVIEKVKSGEWNVRPEWLQDLIDSCDDYDPFCQGLGSKVLGDRYATQERQVEKGGQLKHT